MNNAPFWLPFATVLIVMGFGFPALSKADPLVHLASEHLEMTYEASSGNVSLRTKSGEELVRKAMAAVLCPTGEISLRDRRYSRRQESSDATEPELPGKRLTILCKDEQGQLDLEYRITLLRDRAAAVFELVMMNVSKQDVQLQHAEPLRALRSEDSGCFFGLEGGKRATMKALTNGYIYYDPGKLYDFGPAATRKLDSFWNAAFHNPDTNQTLAIGFVENRTAEGHIIASCESSGESIKGAGFDLTARSLFAQHFVLKPGASVSSGRLLLELSADPFSGLEHFADVSARLHKVKLNPVINGWSTWSGYYGDINEDKILRQARFIARELKGYGLDWIQIDDGYYRAFGDWEGDPKKFPHGMKWLAEQIRALGLRPGLWIAPYAISDGTNVAKNHPDWLLHDLDGNIQKIEQAHQGQAQYILDITHPDARKWLFDLFHTITADWGYDFIKTDFVEWTLLAAQRYHDPAMSKAMAYRLGVQTMRDAMGPKRHLLDCGPGPEVVGLIDSMRIELDRPIPENPLWDQYAGHYNSTGPAVAKRYFFHNRMWINDADQLRLAQLTVPQTQAAVTITALSGGNMIAGDRLDELDPARLDAMKKVFPAYGEAARPVDLFESAAPALFAQEVRKPFGQWWLAGCFNWDNKAVKRELQLSRLGLDAAQGYLIYEFWSQRLLKEEKGIVRMELPATSVSLLAIREKRDVPQVIGTDRHYTQGAIELEKVSWDAATNTLSGTALGSAGMNWVMTIHVPPKYRWDGNEHEAVALRDLKWERPLLRARVEFGESERKEWSVRFATE